MIWWKCLVQGERGGRGLSSGFIHRLSLQPTVSRFLLSTDPSARKPYPLMKSGECLALNLLIMLQASPIPSMQLC
jgi:hypothetical protein